MKFSNFLSNFCDIAYWVEKSYCKTQSNLEITRFTIFFSEKQAPVRNNYGSTKSYIFSKKIHVTNLIQCGNEKEEKKRGKKFTNRYLLQKIQRKKYTVQQPKNRIGLTMWV